ncbi:hypothetical protein [Paenibacillus sp. FSL E2-0201]|uniref:hypothetical protein n=1 Tax=Paenibacillus sp. FSL E2-0201 TaxID=2954726 RepID=UPI0030D9864E
MTTFTNAGITGVTLEDLVTFQIQIALETDYTLPRIVSQVQEIVVEAQKAIVVDAAINVIFDYLKSNDLGTAPDLEVFQRAGLTRVTDSNLPDVLSALVSAYEYGLSGQDGLTPLSPHKQVIEDAINRYLDGPNA